ncbi:MAG: NADH:ubiquinone oxidoreductase subunit NDUFA12 [Pseudomonadota bacterium]|nr:NADH:ubiquinone oxidoreductase subunit NDUFA12 [Pseudomonadota bacterium]MDE3038443.1 NADH:ubiquinone oxidoreductase subunit NDUFA12 [Pseudomonadota bacterium]
MTVTMRLYTVLNGTLIGRDMFGNRYYAERHASKNHRRRRWVMYKGIAEPSKVPAEWHSWLHYTLDLPLTQRHIRRYAWEKPHVPNLTGTPNAYLPPGHLLRGAHRGAATADYEAWQP